MKDIRWSFWTWVGSRKAGDNPRGDFIRDTRGALAAGANPDTLLHQAIDRAGKEHDLLWRRFARENDLSPEAFNEYLLIPPKDDGNGNCHAEVMEEGIDNVGRRTAPEDL